MNWKFEDWPAIKPKWHGGGRGHRPDDQIEFHVDLGCGRLKKGRIGVDRFPDARDRSRPKRESGCRLI